MYEQFYGFREKPFQIAPNPAFLYKSNKHQAALTYLEYGLAENVGFILLTGEIGSGKTTLVQYLTSRLDAATRAAVIFNTSVSGDELLGLILEEFEVPRAGDKAACLSAFNQFLVGCYGRSERAVLIIDEAQNLSPAALEEVRLLSNLQSTEQPLLQIMLVGQPELLDKLQGPSLKQFAQRIAARYHLTDLDREDTFRYVEHRLATAGGRPDLFTEAALDLVFTHSAGIPRAINLICQAALVYGFAEGAERISQDIIHQIRKDNLGVGLAPEPRAAAPPAETPAGGNGFHQRIESLETGLQDIKQLMTTYLQEMGDKSKQASGEQFMQLVELLKQERRQKEDLVREVARLETENKSLKRVGRWLQAKLKGR